MSRFISWKHLRIAVVTSICVTLPVCRLAAADRAVVSSGSWSATSTWSGSLVPGVNDNGFVGSTTPTGALSTATVTLTQDVTAGNLYLGHNTGTSGTLELGDFTFTGKDLYFGFVGTGSITRGTGHLDINTFDIRNGNTFTLAPNDVVHNAIDLAGASALTLGANLTVSADIDLRDSGTVFDAQHFNIQANQFLLGWNNSGTPQWLNRGNLTANQLLVRGQNFQLTAADSVARFTLSACGTNLGSGVAVGRLDLSNGATATTVETGNVTSYVLVELGSTLTLGANLNLTDSVNIRGSGTVLDANGHDISAASQILLGWDATGAALQNRGKLTANELLVRGQNFQLTAADAINNFYMNNGTTNLGSGVAVQRLILTNSATATTVAAGNISKSVTLQSGSTLTLGANLALSENLNLSEAGTVLNADGHNISTPNQFLYGWDSTGTPVLQNIGTLNVGELLQRNGTQLALASGADTLGRLYLQGNSHLTAAVSAGGTGLTLTRTQANELDIEAGSHLTLALDGNQAGWVFRWSNPTGGDHVVDLTTLISDGKIDFALQNSASYSITTHADGYTYITMAPVPEPAAVLGLSAALAGLVMGLGRRRRPRPVSDAV